MAFVVVVFLSTSVSAGNPAVKLAQQPDESRQNHDAAAQSCVQEPVENLIHRIPELSTLQPSADQGLLPMILEKAGENVNVTAAKFSDMVAKEKVSEEELDLENKPLKQRQDEYQYFIGQTRTVLEMFIDEYRRDKDGNEEPPEAKFLSTGFASSVLYFAKGLQRESAYRYLGEDVIGARGTYVVAFAQNPWKAGFRYRIRKPDGAASYVLIQGIAWVDKDNFQILRMRTEILPIQALLEGQEENENLETVVTFAEVQPEGVSSSLWLPIEANVTEEFEGQRFFRNTHLFSDYRRYHESQGYTASFAQKTSPEPHPYIEDLPNELVKRIPELKGFRPAPDQRALPMILNKAGAEVDQFFDHMVDLIADEEIKQERLGNFSSTRASETTRDNYLILRHASGTRADFDEFRMDENGNRKDQVGLTRGFLVTSGFALISIHYSLEVQWDSRFRYLGDQKINGRDTYVVAFAQLPGVAHLTVTMKGPRGTAAHMLMQGVAWVDKGNFHIVRMQTDLLNRQPEIGLEAQTTKVDFGETRLADVASPLWLPRTVNVYVQIGAEGDRSSKEQFRNMHHYSNYRRYRVSTRMVAPQ
jgi:hypothetical protein